MSDLDAKTKRSKNGDLNEDVHLLAARALAVLAQQRAAQLQGLDVVQPERLAERIHFLADLFLSRDAEEAKLAVDRVLGDGVSINDTIDHVLPAVARLLGERWFADDISFVDVSIGTARLQETVRSLRARERAIPAATERVARVLMVIPASEEHTFGMVVAADQLRRRGLLVDLSVAERRQELALRVRNANYKMIGITASGVRTVAAVKELVDNIRRNAQQFTPIVLGGAIAEADEQLKERVAVDMISTDICDAAKRFGLLPASAAKLEELGR